MSSPKIFRRTALLAGACLLLTGGCSGLRPLYGTSAAPGLRFAEPKSRLEQIIYHELALRFAAGDASAPLVAVAASQGGTPRLVTAQVTMTGADDDLLLTATRSQSAGYETGPQVLANKQAEVDAAARAARLLADTIRLEILAALAR